MDLDLPRTGIEDYEDKITLPGRPTNDPQQQQITMQFLAMISLQRVISRIHVDLFEGMFRYFSQSQNQMERHVIYSSPVVLKDGIGNLYRCLEVGTKFTKYYEVPALPSGRTSCPTPH